MTNYSLTIGHSCQLAQKLSDDKESALTCRANWACILVLDRMSIDFCVWLKG